MSECSHNCGTCGENCSSRTQDKKSFLEALWGILIKIKR